MSQLLPILLEAVQKTYEDPRADPASTARFRQFLLILALADSTTPGVVAEVLSAGMPLSDRSAFVEHLSKPLQAKKTNRVPPAPKDKDEKKKK